MMKGKCHTPQSTPRIQLDFTAEYLLCRRDRANHLRPGSSASPVNTSMYTKNGTKYATGSSGEYQGHGERGDREEDTDGPGELAVPLQ
jgi:hypothetical protein